MGGNVAMKIMRVLNVQPHHLHLLLLPQKVHSQNSFFFLNLSVQRDQTNLTISGIDYSDLC